MPVARSSHVHTPSRVIAVQHRSQGAGIAGARALLALLTSGLLLAAACGGNEPAADEGGRPDRTGTDQGPDGPGPDTPGPDGSDGAPDQGDGGPDLPADLPDLPPADLTGTTPAAVGDPCQRSSDCGAAGFCLAEESAGTPGGYCTAACNISDDCGEGAECVTGTTGRFCLRSCTTDGDCREGYICQADILDAQGQVCVAGTPGSAGAAPGDACQDNADCPRAGFCLLDSGGFPDGYCVTGCDPQVADSCGAGSACVEAATGPFCVKACSSGGDCRSGYACAQGIVGIPTDGTVCAPGQSGRVTPGAPCDSHGDCTAGAGLCRLDAPGGACTEVCNPANLTACGVGATCIGVSAQDPAAGVCLASCTPGVGAECGVVRGNDPQAARYACSTQAFGKPLGAGAGVCLEFTADAGVGGACAATGDCQLGGLCLAESGTALAGGYCSDQCDPAGATDACAAGQICLNTGAGGICLDGCAADTDCRQDDGYACRTLPAGNACLPRPCTSQDDCQQGALSCLPGAGGGNVCSPCRSNDDCRNGQTCAGGRCRLPA